MLPAASSPRRSDSEESEQTQRRGLGHRHEANVVDVNRDRRQHVLVDVEKLWNAEDTVKSFGSTGPKIWLKNDSPGR